jgi:PKD repeat protein
MIWTVTANGKKMPVDADPAVAPRGFRVDEGEDPPVATFTAAPDVGERLYQSHYASCPQANDWRKP